MEPEGAKFGRGNMHITLFVGQLVPKLLVTCENCSNID